MKALERLFAEKLLKVKAVKIQPATRLHGLQVGNLLFIVITVKRCHILHFVTL